MNLKPRLILSAGLGLLVVLAVACGSGGNKSTTSSSTPAAAAPTTAANAGGVTPCPPSGSATALTGAGSTFDYPLFSKLFDDYNNMCHVQVNYQSIGSGAGIEQLTKKTVNFGASDAPMTDQQIQAAGGDILHVPITIGAVSVGYNLPGVSSGVKMTGDVLTKIYMGQITKWNDPALTALNPGMKLPDLPIAVVHRSDGSGTTFIFTSYLSAVSPDWKTKVGASTSVNWPTGAGGKGSEGVAGVVKQTPGGIGYFELAYSTQNNIASVSMQNQAGQFVAPSVQGASLAAAGAANNMPPDLRAVFVNAPGQNVYPISGFSWVVINQGQTDAKAAPAVVHLLWWMINQGQQSATALQYAPLPDPVVKLDEGQLKKVTVNGQPVLGAS
jgi:phosphate transport system substrate-binding protein